MKPSLKSLLGHAALIIGLSTAIYLGMNADEFNATAVNYAEAAQSTHSSMMLVAACGIALFGGYVVSEEEGINE